MSNELHPPFGSLAIDAQIEAMIKASVAEPPVTVGEALRWEVLRMDAGFIDEQIKERGMSEELKREIAKRKVYAGV